MEKDIYNEYLNLIQELKEFNKDKIPLCAAETYSSEFVKSALSSEFEGKYCMQHLNYVPENDFIGSEYVHRLYDLLTEQCKLTFNSQYADARTLSGMNCISIVINCLIPKGSKVLLTTGAQGGHPSVPLLLNLAGIDYDEVPYDYDESDIDYVSLNNLMLDEKYSALIIAQSDVLNPADASRIAHCGKLIVYDATQTFGMIAAHIHKNPLDYHDNLILIGGTHKTLPGPTCGLILLNNEEIIRKIDNLISPSYLRNAQPNNIAALLLALLEQEKFGFEYQKKTVENANILGEKLEKLGFNVKKIGENEYTRTHQIFILTTQEKKELIVKNANRFGITLNGKEKKLFDGFGIRFGLQEVTRYGWNKDDMVLVSELISEIAKETPDAVFIKEAKRVLSKKKQSVYSFL